MIVALGIFEVIIVAEELYFGVKEAFILLLVGKELVDILYSNQSEIQDITNYVEIPQPRGELKTINESQLLSLVSGVVAVGSGTYALTDVSEENVSYAISIYADLPPEMQCQTLAIFYNIYNQASTINELSQDYYNMDYDELGEDEMKYLITEYAGQYDVDTGSMCFNLSKKIIEDNNISILDQINDN